MQIRVNTIVATIEPLPAKTPLHDDPDLCLSEAVRWVDWLLPTPPANHAGTKAPVDRPAGHFEPSLVQYGAQAAQTLGLDPTDYSESELTELAREQLTEHVLSGHAEALLPCLGPPTRQALARALLVEIGLDPDRRVDVPMPIDPENPLAPEAPKAVDYYLRRDGLALEDIRYMSAHALAQGEGRRLLDRLPRSLTAEFDARFGAYADTLAAQACTRLGGGIASVADEHGIDLAKAPITLSRVKLRCHTKEVDAAMRGGMAALRPVVSERMVAELRDKHARLAAALNHVLRQAQGPEFRSEWWQLDSRSASAAARVTESITQLEPVAARGRDGTRMAVLAYGEGGGYTPYDIALDERMGPVMLADRAGWLYETLPITTLERYRVQSSEMLHALVARGAGVDGTIMYQQRHYARIGADYIGLTWDPALWAAERPVWRVVPPAGVTPDLVFHRLAYDAEKSLWRRAETAGLCGGVGEKGASTSHAETRTPSPRKIDPDLEDHLNARIPDDLPHSRDAYTDHLGQWRHPTGRIADSETVLVSRQLLEELTDTTTQIGWHQRFSDYFDVQLPRAAADAVAADPAAAARQERAVTVLPNLLHHLETTSPTFRGLVNRAIDQGRLGTAVNTRWTLVLMEPSGTRNGMSVYAGSFSTGKRTSYLPDPASGHMADDYYISADGKPRPMTATRRILINLASMLTGQRNWSTSRGWLPHDGAIPHSLEWTGLGERGASFYLSERIARESRLGQWSLLSDAEFRDRHVTLGARGDGSLPDIRFTMETERMLRKAGTVDAMRAYAALQNNYLEGLFPLRTGQALVPAMADTVTVRGIVLRNRIPPHILSGRRPYSLGGVTHHPAAQISRTETVVAARQVLETATDPTEYADILTNFDRYFDIGVAGAVNAAFVKLDPAWRNPQAWQEFSARMIDRLRNFIKQLYRDSETFRRIVNRAVRTPAAAGPADPRWRVNLPRWLVEVRLPREISIRNGVDHYSGILAGNPTARHATVPYPFGGRVSNGAYYLAADGTMAMRDVQHETVRSLLQMFTGAVDPSQRAWMPNGNLQLDTILTHGPGERGGLEVLAQRILREKGCNHAPIVSLLPFSRKEVRLKRVGPDEPHPDFTPGTLMAEPARTLKRGGGLQTVNDYVALQNRYLDALFPVGDPGAWGGAPAPTGLANPA